MPLNHFVDSKRKHLLNGAGRTITSEAIDFDAIDIYSLQVFNFPRVVLSVVLISV